MKKINFAIIAMVFLLGTQTSVLATPSLLIDDGNGGITPFTVVDGSAQDANPVAGVVTYVGSVGVWFINVTTGITKPAVGNSIEAFMDLSSVTSSSSGGELDLFFTETGFQAPPTGISSFQMSVGGTTSGTVLARWDINGPSSDPLGVLGPLAGGAFSGTLTNSANLTETYSLTSATIINHQEAGTTSFNQELKAVPEPSIIFLLGFGLIGIGLGAKRFRKKEL